ncbi:spermidine synthase [Chitinophaga costaii]|uniref:Polyamine aminopropyltransferase n=1 Tax=Chitinophaga costaii TaxID=1335309 RepID=A0A1C4EUQ4_9BACT|nr:polyamine aminopropyltransferase [Chitinophaga costaii]PUZ21641.1 polyamine aminopropyltransferase [Chitinophaga costaii]SCC47250.1 spermidine synthase [Chitinophaga costaii]
MIKMVRPLEFLLLLSVFIIATCGLIYELVAGTLASYLLGDSITQFSTIIGAYLFSMGIGAYLSRFFRRELLSWFIQLEILVGLIGGISSAVLFLVFEHAASFRLVLYLLVGLTGILVGLELPLLMNILKNRYAFRDLVSRVFTFDYIGALLASIVFPLLLVPYFGLIRTSCFFGILNVVVAIVVCVKFREEVKWARYLQFKAVGVIVLLTGIFWWADKIMTFSESEAFRDPVIFSHSSPYQRIVITRSKLDLRLYLNGNLQFSSVDEYRYHEALVHPAMMYSPEHTRVLILGGGDGMAAREILKYPDVEIITLVDLDPSMTRLFRQSSMLAELNHHSLQSPKLQVINADAFQWLKTNKTLYDVAFVDFPDPGNYAVGKLYTTAFYRQLRHSLTDSSVIVVQSTSPFVAPKAFWCVDATLHDCGYHTQAYHTYVPSFGEWGYVMASPTGLVGHHHSLPAGLRYFAADVFPQMCQFTADMAKRPVLANHLNNQVLVQYFEDEWGKYQE